MAELDLTQALKKNRIIIVTAKGDSYHKATTEAMQELAKKKNLKGLYLTYNMPSKSLEDKHRKQKISAAKVCFVDAISKRFGSSSEVKNCHYIEDPSSLTQLSYTITGLLQSDKLIKFLVFDSISAMLAYNDVEVCVRFLHFLITKIRNAGIYAVFITSDDPKSKEIIPLISEFADINVRY